LTNVSSCNFSGDRQIFDFPTASTKLDYLYVKYVGHGNTLNTSNNISEMKVFGTPDYSANIGKRKIVIYPNPVHDYINISIEEATFNFDRVRIIDLSGKVVFEKVVNPLIKSLQFPVNLNSGIYLIDLGLNNLVLFTQELIVNK
jgi:hypothetical protein